MTEASNTAKISDLAKIFSDTEGRLVRLIADGKIKEVARGRVGLVEAVQAFLDDLRADLRANTASASVEKAREARADAAQLRLAEKRREVIPRDEAEAAVDYVCGAINSALASIPARVTRDPMLRRRIDAVVLRSRKDIGRRVKGAKK